MACALRPSKPRLSRTVYPAPLRCDCLICLAFSHLLETWQLVFFCHWKHETIRRITPVYPPKRLWQFARGGFLPHIRGICAISAALAGPLAASKCQFSGLLPRPRLPFRREICKCCEICESIALFAPIHNPYLTTTR